MINIRFILLSFATISGVIVGMGITQLKEKNNLLRESSRLKKIEDSLSNFKTKYNMKVSENPGHNPGSLLLEKGSTQSPNTLAFSKGNRIPNTENSLMRLKDYIKSIEEKNTFLKEKVELLTSLLDAKEKEILKLNEYNIDLKDNLKKTIETQDKLKTEFEAKLQSLNAQLVQKDSELSTLNTIKISLEYQIEDLNKKLTALSNNYAALKNSIQEKTPLEAELGKIKEELKQQKAANETLTKSITGLTEALNNKEKERLNLAQELEKLQSSKMETESELSRLRVTKAEDESQLNELKSRLDGLNSSYEEEKKGTLKLSSLLTKKELEKDLALSDMENQIANMKDSLYKANAERDSANLSLQQKEKKIAEMETKLKNLEPRLTALQDEITLEKERQAQTAEQLNRAMELNNSLKERLKNIATELELLRLEKKVQSKTATTTTVAPIKKERDTSSYIKVYKGVMP